MLCVEKNLHYSLPEYTFLSQVKLSSGGIMLWKLFFFCSDGEGGKMYEAKYKTTLEENQTVTAKDLGLKFIFQQDWCLFQFF